MDSINLIKLENSDYNKKLLIIGVFHGDEFQGEYFINSYLKKSSSCGKNSLYFIPKLNPSGTRKNLNGIDLNRNFPTKNWVLGENNDYFGGFKPNSEKETQFIINIIEKYAPKLIITLHTPFKIVNFDGEAREISEKIAKIFNYPTEESIGYPTPGSFGTWAGIERQIPTITIEMDEECSPHDLVQPFNLMLEMLTSLK